ncbi:hypothetical protein EHW67_16030 [Arenibacter aquaticus]|uniref:Acyltransferase n=1 Tax=Arenibacter aquaticus TaxID=2489054 RepID=A0A3S0AJN1_9FLAO|nr:hypothetical protein [Arenibacter aquaticus]RTE51719.1 hypothetical protein EHW67_16030 [Arenibacter aquaticus]
MRNQFKSLFESLIRNIGGALGRKLRYFYYKTQFKACGTNIIIEEGVFIENPNSMSLGNDIWIDKDSILLGGPFNSIGRKFYRKGLEEINWGDLILGDNVHIAPFSLVQAHGGVKIGNNVTIGSGSKIYSLSHHYKNLNDKLDTRRYSFSSMAPKDEQFLIIGNVSIGDNAAVGLNSVLLPGSKIPNGTWVAVSSVLNGGEIIEENSIYSSRTKNNE